MVQPVAPNALDIASKLHSVEIKKNMILRVKSNLEVSDEPSFNSLQIIHYSTRYFDPRPAGFIFSVLVWLVAVVPLLNPITRSPPPQ